MARTQAGRDATEQHRRRQVALANRVRSEFSRLWPSWTVTDRRGFDRLVDATLPLIESRQVASATEASRYLAAFAMVEGAAAPSVAEVSPFNRDRAAAAMYATGQAQASRSLTAGMSPQAARQTALVTLTGAVVRLVEDGSRQVIEDTVAETSDVQGYMRVTGPNPCAFCAMLASRGPVYKSSALGDPMPNMPGKFASPVVGRSGRQRGSRAPGEPYHDHCVCTLEPFYEGSQMPDDSRRFRDLWNESTRGESGTDALNAFRRAHEGGFTTAA